MKNIDVCCLFSKLIKPLFKILSIPTSFADLFLLKQFAFSFFVRSQIKITKINKQLKFNIDNLNIRNTNHFLFFKYSQILFNRHDKYIFDKFNIQKILKKKNLNILGIAPGSGYLEKHKRWSKEYFVSLTKMLMNKYKFNKIYIIGSTDEISIMNYIKSNLQSFNTKIISGNIIKSIESIRKAKMVISNDNGISHISRFLNIETYIIAGPTHPNYYLHPKITKILRNKIACSPCYQFNRYGCGNEN